MNEQLKAMLEQQLRDPHVPDTVSWWPLAIGWWGLIIGVLGLVVLAFFKFLNRRRRNAYRKIAARELANHFSSWETHRQNAAYLQAANSVLKRACSHFSNEANNLSTQPWLDFLNRHSKTPLSKDTETALSLEMYQLNAVCNINKVHEDILNWLSTHKTAQAAYEATEAKHA